MGTISNIELKSSISTIEHSGSVLIIEANPEKVSFELKDISPRHFYTDAGRLGLGGEIRKTVEGILEMTPEVISDVTNMLPKQFPLQVADTILTGLKKSAEKSGSPIK